MQEHAEFAGNDSRDPRSLIASDTMGGAQILVLALTVALNALDGFDVLSISFASPGIAQAWDVDRAALGVVLAMELIGMAVGSIFIGNASDRFGRRPVVLACLVLMTVSMFLASGATSIVDLAIWRVVTGLGIGGMLATTNAVVAEFASDRRRSLAIAIMGAGYPAGAVIGGTMSSALLTVYDWRSVFILGGSLSAVLTVVTLFCLPETIAWLVHRRPTDALDKINRILIASSHAAITVMPPAQAHVVKPSIGALFRGTLGVGTLTFAVIYFGQMISFYFILKWSPKIVADMGFAASMAGVVLVWANVGGLIGSVLVGLLSQRFDARRVTGFAMLLAMLSVAAFGRSPHELSSLAALAFLACLFGNGAMVGLYALLATAYPTALRATATGLIIGVGRGGAALSPIFAGLLFQHGLTLSTIAAVMAIGTGIGGLLLLTLAWRMVPVRASNAGALNVSMTSD